MLTKRMRGSCSVAIVNRIEGNAAVLIHSLSSFFFAAKNARARTVLLPQA